MGRPVLGVFGMLGAALFFADGALTPAISVLSAVEGLTVERPGAQFLVVPITLVILVGSFRLQARGTAKVGNLFGPVMFDLVPDPRDCRHRRNCARSREFCSR